MAGTHLRETDECMVGLLINESYDDGFGLAELIMVTACHQGLFLKAVKPRKIRFTIHTADDTVCISNHITAGNYAR